MSQNLASQPGNTKSDAVAHAKLTNPKHNSNLTLPIEMSNFCY